MRYSKVRFVILDLQGPIFVKAVSWKSLREEIYKNEKFSNIWQIEAQSSFGEEKQI